MESFGILIHAARTCRKTPTPAPSQRTRFALSVIQRRSKRSSSAWYAFSRSTEYTRAQFLNASLKFVLRFFSALFRVRYRGYVCMLKFCSFDKPPNTTTGSFMLLCMMLKYTATTAVYQGCEKLGTGYYRLQGSLHGSSGLYFTSGGAKHLFCVFLFTTQFSRGTRYHEPSATCLHQRESYVWFWSSAGMHCLTT